MSNNKKLLTVLLAVMLVVSFIVGCSGGSGTKENPASSSLATTAAPSATSDSKLGDTGGLKLPIVDKPMTLSIMVISENANLGDSRTMKEIEKRTGIKLNVQAFSAQTYQEKLKIVVASGKLPDIFQGLTQSEANKMGMHGALEPINKHLNDLPNFKKLYVDDPENSWVMKSFSNDENNVYTWPIYGLQRDVNLGFMYRKDIFDKLGIKEWTNSDEFYNVLKQLKEAYPQSFPYAAKTKEAIFDHWSYGWGIGGANFPAYYDEKDRTWKLQYTQPEYKAMLDFMKKLYSEGLMDPEFITDTEASWTGKMTTDKSFVTYDWIGRMEQFANQVKSQNPDYDLRFGNPVGPTGNQRSLPKIDNFGIVVANNDKKEIALKLLDYLTSPSGGSLITMGIEGETYNLNDGKPVYPELQDMPNVDINTLQQKYGMWVQPMYIRPDKRSVYYNFTEKEQEAQDKIVKENKFEALDPVLKFSDEETKTIAELRAAILKAGNEFSTKYIMKTEFGDAQWEEWKQSVEKLDAAKYIEAFNSAQKRFNEAK